MKKTDAQSIDIIVYTIWAIFFIFFLSTYNYTGRSASVIITFYLIGIISFFMSIKPQRNVSIKRNIYIFYLIFFFFAPMKQYISGTRLWTVNGMSVVYNDEDYLFANICILISIILFETGSYLARRKLLKRRNNSKIIINQKNTIRRNLVTMQVLAIIVIIASLIIVGANGLSSTKGSTAIVMQIKHMILFSPIICLIISLIGFKAGKKNSKIFVIFFGIISIFLFVFFSGTMARFMLLGAAMAVLSCFMVDNQNQSLYFSIYVAGFFFAFSMLRQKNLFSGNLLSFVDFCYYDYDAYQVFMLVIHYVKNNGISWGMNLLSAMCCMIPRSLASWRLESTGGIVMTYAGSWFKNVSCPLTAEMYFAFGIPGIAVISFLLGYGVRFFDSQCEKSNDFIKGLFAIISGMSIYIMRGSLLVAFSYTFGICLAYWAIYEISHYIIKIKN